MNSLKENILQIIYKSIDSVKPQNLFPEKIYLQNHNLLILDSVYDLSRFKNVYIVGMGKASAEIAFQLELILGNKISDGIVATKEGHSSPTKIVKIFESSHPYPDKSCLHVGKLITDLCSKAKKDDLIINLISGGGSVLAEVLNENVLLDEWISLNKQLIKSGADISEINLIRQRLSKIKNGGLLNYIFPAKSISLIISDVIGDKLEFIASGPTYYKQINSDKINSILEKYELKSILSSSALKVIFETDNQTTHTSNNFIVANNDLLVDTAAAESKHFQFNNIIKKPNVSGDIRNLSKIIANDLLNNFDTLFIYGGESTVKVKGDGVGGRNQELTLRVFDELKNSNKEFVFASVGSDGTDGPTDAAGAILSNHDAYKKVSSEINKFLTENDSYNFHKRNGSLIKTGPTKTNVMDLMIGYLK